MSKEIVLTIVLTTVVSNILTYQSFKYYRKPINLKNSNSGETFVMYPLISLYVVLYSMVILLVSKWSVEVAHTTFKFDKTFIVNIITEAIQGSFQNALRIIPFSLFIGLITSFFEKPIIFNTDGKFSPFYLAFMFVITILSMFIYRNNSVELSEQGIISAFIIFVTIISIFKVNQPTLDTKNASTGLDRFVNFCLNFFLNFNVKIIYIFMPFILFFTIAFFMITGATMEKVLKISALVSIFIFSFIIIALIHGAIKKHQRKSKSGRDAAKNFSKMTSAIGDAFTTVLNPAVLRPFMKTSMYLAIYSVPLAAYIYFTSKDFSLFKEKYFATFNKQFLEILAFSYIVTSILHKFISITQEQINKVVSLQIVIALALSNNNFQNSTQKS